MEIPIYLFTVPYPIQGRGQFPSTAVKNRLRINILDLQFRVSSNANMLYQWLYVYMMLTKL